MRQLLSSIDPGILDAYPVSRIVNSPDKDWEECIEPVAADQE